MLCQIHGAEHPAAQVTVGAAIVLVNTTSARLGTVASPATRACRINTSASATAA